MTVGLAVAVALLVGGAWALVTPTILRRLAEPTDVPAAGSADPGDLRRPGDKIPYASLATRPFALAVGGITAAATAVPAVTLPVACLPAWSVLATLGVLLAGIDARTTWLPLALTRAAWVAMAVAVGVTGLLGGWVMAVRAVAGFALAGAIFGGIWLLTRGGFGFGDVRYAPLVGAATSGVSWTLLAWGLVLGSLVGAVVGLVRLATRRTGEFAYAPSILAGGYLAVALSWLTT